MTDQLLPVATGRRAGRVVADELRARPLAASLQRKPRSDRDVRRLPPDLVGVVEGLALNRPAPTTAFIHRRVADAAPARGWPVPSYSTVRSIVAGIDPGLRGEMLDIDAFARIAEAAAEAGAGAAAHPADDVAGGA